MKKSLENKNDLREQGSALLIVLGFLSFMMISAVAFAIYMRIERQASSNFRYASSARQLVNASLFRAMDEIDRDLRLGVERKFPDWKGRVRPSTFSEGSAARVLSLDALTYIPGILLNDVRAYAVPGAAGSDFSGAKWLPLSMPMIDMEGNQYVDDDFGGGANGGAVVGRYAYICVNVSDMLDVNKCRANLRDAGRNRVCIAHLFKDDQREKFDERVSKDIHYSTLSDFYACMFENRGDTTPFSSPWYEYLDSNDDLDPFRETSKHILVTDSKVKSELFNPDPESKLPPFNVLNRATGEQPVADIDAKEPTCTPSFITALTKALEGTSNDMDAYGYESYVLGSLLSDYLDDDNFPKSLIRPTVELAPLISQISVMPGLSVKLISTPGASDDDPVMYSLDLDSVKTLPLNVETIWPFKYSSLRENQGDYGIEVKAYLKIHFSDHTAVDSSKFADDPTADNGYLLEYTMRINAKNTWQDIQDSDDACTDERFKLEGNFLAGDKGILDLFDSDDEVYNNFILGSKISFSFVLAYVQVYYEGQCVDSVPCNIPEINSPGDLEWARYDKLFFHTEPSGVLKAPAQVGILQLPFKCSCLETPDPRFNWDINNWFRSEKDKVDGELNDSTRKMLGEDGRDADVFMAISNMGVLQSPGELGFLLRPFVSKNRHPQNRKIKFSERNYEEFVKDEKSDHAAMFRTFRLYDHEGSRHDDIYKYFCASDNADGTVVGCRVNPLSDIPLVRGGAIDKTPLDYYVAGKITEITASADDDDTKAAAIKSLFPGEFEFTQKLQQHGNSWNNFTNGWNRSFNDKIREDINRDLNVHLSDKYCDSKFFDWYSSEKEERDEIFDVTLTTPLHEVDRKMLYSFSLDSFSDRQQLFLYFVRAEVTASAFGRDVGSLAGGKAVALVWRDPYPVVKKGGKEGESVQPKDMYPGHASGDGEDGYYEQNIIYFKYLDN